MNAHSTDSTFSDITARDMLSVLFKHKVKITLFYLFAVAVTILLVITTPDMYMSEAALIVEAGRENINQIPTADADRAITMSRSQVYDTNNELEILRSPSIYEDLVAQIGVENFLPEEVRSEVDLSNDVVRAQLEQDIAVSIREGIDIQNRRNTSILSIAFVASSSQLAHQVVATLIELFLQKHIEIHYSDSMYEFFRRQTESTQQELTEVERQLAEIYSRLDVNSMTEYTVQVINRREGMTTDRDNINTSIAATRSRIDYLNSQLAQLPDSSDEQSLIGTESLREELRELMARERELLSRYTEQNVQVVEVRRQIAETTRRLNEQMQNQTVSAVDPQQIQASLLQEQAMLTSLYAQLDEIDRQLADLDRRKQLYDDVYPELSQLERRRDNLLDSVQEYSNNLEEAQIDQVVQEEQLSNISIMQEATVPKQPLDSKKNRTLAIGLFLGVLGGVAIAMFYEYFDHTLSRQEDVEKWLKTRTLVVIPNRPKQKYGFQKST